MRSAVFLLLMLLSVPVFAAEVGKVSFDLETDHIDITTGFHGKNLVVFGTKNGPGSLEIIVEGPRRDMVVRKKESVAGAWVNRHSDTLKGLPVFYEMAREDYGGSMEFPFVMARKPEFAEAFIRNKRAQGLYPETVQPLKFLDQRLFRADFYIPANVPMGQYSVRAVYEEGGQRSEQYKTFVVAQVGANAQVEAFAHNQSLLYGVLCVSLALFAGWFSNRVRRRS